MSSKKIKQLLTAPIQYAILIVRAKPCPSFHLPSLEFPMAIQCDCYLTRLVGVDKPCPHFRMHDLPRIEIRDDMTQDLKDLLEGYNDQCERVEAF